MPVVRARSAWLLAGLSLAPNGCSDSSDPVLNQVMEFYILVDSDDPTRDSEDGKKWIEIRDTKVVAGDSFEREWVEADAEDYVRERFHLVARNAPSGEGVQLLAYADDDRSMRPAELSDWRIDSVFESVDELGRPALGFTFNDEGSRQFERLTANNVGKRLAIVIDGRIVSAPAIHDHVVSGSGIVTGSFGDAGVEEMMAEIGGESKSQ